MPKLATVEDVRGRGSIPESDDVNTRISIALDSATIHLASALRTTFDLTVNSDQYWVSPHEFPYTDQFVKLFLKQGFVDKDSNAPNPYELRFAALLVDLASADLVEDEFLKRDDDKGQLLITGWDGAGAANSTSLRLFTFSGEFFAQLDYTAGFSTKGSNFGKIFRDVPDWLEEAATMTALQIYREGCGELEGKAAAWAIIHALIEQYIRFMPSALKPLV